MSLVDDVRAWILRTHGLMSGRLCLGSNRPPLEDKP